MGVLESMTVSEWAAWWGAIVATVVLLWDVYKWKKAGANVSISVSPDMQLFQPGQGLEDKTYIVVEVVNNGDRPTTITHLFLKTFKNRFEYFRKKTSMNAVVPDPGGTQGIPFVLEPGNRWNGMIDQADLKEKAARPHLFFP